MSTAAEEAEEAEGRFLESWAGVVQVEVVEGRGAQDAVTHLPARLPLAHSRNWPTDARLRLPMLQIRSDQGRLSQTSRCVAGSHHRIAGNMRVAAIHFDIDVCRRRCAPSAKRRFARHSDDLPWA